MGEKKSLFDGFAINMGKTIEIATFSFLAMIASTSSSGVMARFEPKEKKNDHEKRKLYYGACDKMILQTKRIDIKRQVLFYRINKNSISFQSTTNNSYHHCKSSKFLIQFEFTFTPLASNGEVAKY